MISTIFLLLCLLDRELSFVSSFATRICSRRFASSSLSSAHRRGTTGNNNNNNESPSTIVDWVDAAGYGQRLVRLTSHGTIKNGDDVPRILEVFVHGQATLTRLVEIVASNPQAAPRVVVESPSWFSTTTTATSGKEETQQRTTIDLGQITNVWSEQESAQLNKEIYDKAVKLVDRYRSHPDQLDKLLDKVYARLVRKGRKNNTKTKTLHRDDHVKAIAKKLQKTGPGYARLLDSSLLSNDLLVENPVLARMLAFLLLAADAQQGGRFKRWPSLLVSHLHNEEEEDEWVIVNGGWLVVDQNVRAGTEARMLVGHTTNGPTDYSTSVAEERILQRLECLAMGEVFNPEDLKLEKDVRETLRTMDLSLTSQGASQALVRMGRWSPSTQSKLKQAIQPWSPQIMEAASWYAGLNWQDWMDNSRTDLRQLPAVCVDAKSTTFRDDAMSVRPRARTGRWLDEDASKWEILIHITDVSDIYVPSNAVAPDKHGYLPTLRRAAESRGISRYDLPLGPLHLLPPIVLQTLSFSKTDPHRCVTLWVYIDERDGRLLDAGFERSVVAPPTRASYSEASKLMATKRVELSKDLSRTRSILLLVERNLKLWKDRRVRESEAANKREKRLESRASDRFDTMMDHDPEDGSSGFRRTRGHQLVDTCLDMYSFAGRRLLQKAQVPIPMAAGAEVSKGARLATAPLRRYIDGQSQRQLLAVTCNFGNPMSLAECREAGSRANRARNAIANVRAGR
eukprot:scaffold3034_cov173-Amphora_coffeaeformis.AAC.9